MSWTIWLIWISEIIKFSVAKNFSFWRLVFRQMLLKIGKIWLDILSINKDFLQYNPIIERKIVNFASDLCPWSGPWSRGWRLLTSVVPTMLQLTSVKSVTVTIDTNWTVIIIVIWNSWQCFSLMFMNWDTENNFKKVPFDKRFRSWNLFLWSLLFEQTHTLVGIC